MDLETLLDGKEFVFRDTLVESEYKLLALEGSLLHRIQNGKPIWIKAAAGDDAVVCTDSETFTLQMVETSNTLLLADLPVVEEGDDPRLVAGAVEIAGIVGCAYEAKPVPPRVGLLASLLKRSAISLADAASMAEDDENDADRPAEASAEASAASSSSSTTPSHKRSRPGSAAQGGDDSQCPPAALLTPASSSSAAAPARAARLPQSTPSSDSPAARPSVISSGLKREKDAVATEKQFSLNQLEAVIQASRGEIVTELRRMGAVEHKGKWRAMTVELRDKLLADVVDAVADNAMPLLAVRASSIVTFLGDSYPEFLVRHALGRLGRGHPTQPGRCCLSVTRVARCLGRQLLAACRERAADSKAGVMELGEFGGIWRAAVGRLLALGGPQTLAEARGDPGEAEDGDAEFELTGFRPTVKILGGLLLQTQRGDDTFLEYFPEDELPLDESIRFRALFARQTEWAQADMEPFVERLAGPGRSLPELLLKHTRVVNKRDGTIVLTARG